MLHRCKCAFIALEPANNAGSLFHHLIVPSTISVAYYHPVNRRLISNLSLEDISSHPTVKRLRRRESPALVSLFIKFKYIPEEDPEEIQTTESDRHKCYLRPVCRDGQSCGKTGYLRYSTIAEHICPLLEHCPVTAFPKTIVRQTSVTTDIVPTTKPRRIIPGVKSIVQNAVLDLLSATSISFSLVCSQQFRRFMQTLVSLGQSHSVYNPETLIPYLDYHSFPQLILKKLESNVRSLLSSLRNKTVALMCDAGTVNHHHYFTITITEFKQNSHILFLKIVSGPWTAEDYTITLLKVMKQLFRFNIVIGTIITDGLAAQSAGIQMVRSTIATKQDVELEGIPFIPLHLPCYNHRVNLALTDIFEQNTMLEGIRQVLLTFSTESDKARYQSLLKKHCPSFIKTRWLSLWFIASFVRLKEE